jgi:hypothetical protein
MLADAYADRLFGAQQERDDILAFRAGLAERSTALARVFALVRGELKLVTEAVAVPLSEYGQLSVEDFMVSLYNGHSVQRIRIVTADGTREDARDVLAKAFEALR